MKVMALARC